MQVTHLSSDMQALLQNRNTHLILIIYYAKLMGLDFLADYILKVL